jgi:hypothetical protein
MSLQLYIAFDINVHYGMLTAKDDILFPSLGLHPPKELVG